MEPQCVGFQHFVLWRIPKLKCRKTNEKTVWQTILLPGFSHLSTNKNMPPEWVERFYNHTKNVETGERKCSTTSSENIIQGLQNSDIYGLHWGREDAVPWAWIFGVYLFCFQILLSSIAYLHGCVLCILPASFHFCNSVWGVMFPVLQDDISSYRLMQVTHSDFDTWKPKSFLTSRHAGQCRFLINSCNRTWAHLSEPFPFGYPKKKKEESRWITSCLRLQKAWDGKEARKCKWRHIDRERVGHGAGNVLERKTNSQKGGTYMASFTCV